MSPQCSKVRVILMLLLFSVVTCIPALAGAAVVGSVAGSTNATISGQAILPNTTIFSGDSLAVKDGVAVVAMGRGSRMTFGRETTVSFLRDKDEITVLLSRGNLSLFHPDDSSIMRVRAGEILVEPAKGFKTLGEIAMLGNSLVVSTKEGMLRVVGNGSTIEVAKGKTIKVSPKLAAGQAQAGAAAGMGAKAGLTTGLQVATIGTSAASVGVGAVASSRASDASSAASNALSMAAQATSAATQAASSAKGAQQSSTNLGNAINTVNSIVNPGTPSPFKP